MGWFKAARAASPLRDPDFFAGNAETASKTYGEWALAAPAGAFFHVIQPDPNYPTKVFAGLGEGQGIYSSIDGGRSWGACAAGLECREVLDIAISPFDGCIYAAGSDGLWKSIDGGENWAEDSAFHDKPLLSVAVSPHDPDIVIVGCQYVGGGRISVGISLTTSSSLPGTVGSGMKYTRDNGITWTTLPALDNINGIWIDPEDSQVFAVASTESGLFFSSDGVDGLTRIVTFPIRQRPLCVAVKPGMPSTLFVGTLDGGLYRSEDFGIHWEQAAQVPKGQVSDIKILPGAPAYVVAATPSGLFESSDGGKRWNPSPGIPEGAFCVAVAVLKDGSALMGTSGGEIYRRSSGVSTWNPGSRGLPSAGALLLKEAGRWLFASTVSGLLMSPDGGFSWKPSGLVAKLITAIAVNPEVVPRRVSGTIHPSGLIVRRSSGESRPVILRDDSSLHIFAGTDNGRLFRSIDSGFTWEELAPPGSEDDREIGSIIVFAGIPDVIGALVLGKGFVISEDGGQTWLPDSLDQFTSKFTQVVSSQGLPQRLFAFPKDEGILVSDGIPPRWKECTGIPASEIICSVAESRRNHEVYAASMSGRIFMSNDEGVTFGLISEGPLRDDRERNTWSQVVAYDSPNDSTSLILGCSFGVYINTRGNDTWLPLPLGESGNNYHVNDLQVSNASSRLLMASQKGIFSLSLP